MTFITAGFFAIILAYFAGHTKYKKLLYFSFLIIAIIMGFQTYAGADIYDYEKWFYYQSYEMEIGWLWLNKLFSPLGFRALLICLSLFESFVLCRLILKYVPKKWYWLSVLIFYFTPGYMFFYMSGLRQALAITLFILAFDYIIDKKFIKAIILILVAALFHKTALICLPLVFFGYISEYKQYHKTLFFSIVICLVFVVFYSLRVNLSTLVDEGIVFFFNLNNDFSKYYNYLDMYEIFEISIFILIFDIALLFCAVQSLRKTKTKQDVILIIFLLLSILTQPFVYGMGALFRIFLYVSMFSIASIPIIASKMDSKYGLNYIFAIAIIYWSLHQGIGFINTIQGSEYLNYHFSFN